MNRDDVNNVAYVVELLACSPMRDGVNIDARHTSPASTFHRRARMRVVRTQQRPAATKRRHSHPRHVLPDL